MQALQGQFVVVPARCRTVLNLGAEAKHLVGQLLMQGIDGFGHVVVTSLASFRVQVLCGFPKERHGCMQTLAGERSIPAVRRHLEVAELACQRVRPAAENSADPCGYPSGSHERIVSQRSVGEKPFLVTERVVDSFKAAASSCGGGGPLSGALRAQCYVTRTPP